MKKRYTKKQIMESINYWESVLESMNENSYYEPDNYDDEIADATHSSAAHHNAINTEFIDKFSKSNKHLQVRFIYKILANVIDIKELKNILDSRRNSEFYRNTDPSLIKLGEAFLHCMMSAQSASKSKSMASWYKDGKKLQYDPEVYE